MRPVVDMTLLSRAVDFTKDRNQQKQQKRKGVVERFGRACRVDVPPSGISHQKLIIVKNVVNVFVCFL